ncbi:FAD-dependent oxidoreductase [Bradyrhizobium valentinum]|uniref:FAD-dependent oxidoreductase n=1 Tax=Bradyrhizobium valentinum TaxID=1518501 RepID=UPI00070A51ED|nr:FAD-dependent oxidoreductase [Bradyrhizobium valentinum]KRR00839.1 FAD-binding dehydrogenase [Bradyrhizobium valentinum]
MCRRGLSEVSPAYDVVVIGAGAAGMSAALFSAIQGAKTLLVEKTEFVGGTSALSAGSIWIPNTRHASAAGATDSAANVEKYLQQIVGNHADAALRAAFLKAGPAAIEVLENHSDVKLRAYACHPDYRSELEGAALAGRALEPLPFDGRLLGEAFKLIRPPLPEFTLLGGMMVDRIDIGHLLSSTKSIGSLVHSVRLVARYAHDKASHGRGTRLVMGNALVGRLLYSLMRQDVDILTGASLAKIIRKPDGPVTAASLTSEGVSREIGVNGALILAGGGFNLHAGRRLAALGTEAGWSSVAAGSSGDAQDKAIEIGARLSERDVSAAFWAPASIRRRRDGSQAVFPHFVLDRAKPGTLVVDSNGRRFVNEAISYHQFALEMLAKGKSAIPAFLIADAVSVRKYGLGMVRPGGWGARAAVADGYLSAADTIEQLALRLNIDPGQLRETVDKMNLYAQTGLDPEFGRGSTVYQNHNGDASAGGANPNLGRIATAPFYAVRLYPSDIGTSSGLVTDEAARVLDAGNQPIAGLYACGNDMQSIMGGTYPGPGITLGPAIAFAYIAASDAARRVGIE